MENNQFDLLSIGDATFDVFMTPTESESLCQIDNKESHICFSYGEKIPVKNLDFSVGGNAANNVVGCTRLGVKGSIVLTLGDDNISNLIVETLVKERVDTGYLTRESKSASNFSTIINYSGERTIFTYHAPRHYQFPESLPSVAWIYLTSMGEAFKPFYDQFISWYKTNPTAKLVFNPGSWQLRAGLAGIKDVLALSYIVYVNREEAEKITSTAASKGKEKELLQAMTRLGPKWPIITDGANGSFAFDGEKYYHCGVFPLDAYERTGAGDAFGSGCLAALIKGKSLSEALLWGTLNSASVIGYVGAQRGLLKETEMLEWLDRAKSSKVKIEEF